MACILVILPFHVPHLMLNQKDAAIHQSPFHVSHFTSHVLTSHPEYTQCGRLIWAVRPWAQSR
jgi:hypothetical protein